MKVQNVSVFVGDTSRSGRSTEAAARQEDGKSIYGGNLNKVLDPVAQKRQQARAQAMKVVGDAWDADKKIDKDIQERQNKIADYKKELKAANKELKWFADEREALRESYGVAEDSQEQADLKLLEKRIDAGRGEARLTMEERTRLAEIDAAGLTEYQQRSLEMYEESRYYADIKKTAEQGIKEETQAIEAIKQARLKSQGMVKADAQAEQIMEAASDQIVGMLMDEAKEHIDEEMEEKTEAAEERAEKKEELEERLEKIKEKKEENEELTELLTETTEYMADMENTMDDVKKEIKKMVDEMKLLEEDLKGAAVDVQS